MYGLLRVLGKAYVRLWFPAPDAAACRGKLRRGRNADPAVGATAAARAERFFPTYIYPCRDTTPAAGGPAAPNVLSVTRTRDALLRGTFQNSLSISGELFECPS